MSLTKTTILILLFSIISFKSMACCGSEVAFSTYIIPFKSTSEYAGGAQILKDLMKVCNERHGSMDLVEPYNQDYPVCVITHGTRWLDDRSYIPGNRKEMCNFTDYRQYPPFDYRYHCGSPSNYHENWGKVADIPLNSKYRCKNSSDSSVSIFVGISAFRVSAFEGDYVGEVSYSIRPRRCGAQSNRLFTKSRYLRSDGLVFRFDNSRLVLNTSTLKGELEWPCVKEETDKDSTPVVCEIIP